MPSAFAIFLLLGQAAFGQSSAPGRATLSGVFDPSRPIPNLPATIETNRPFVSPIPPTERAMRSQPDPARRPVYSGLPGVEFVEISGILRSPGVPPVRAPLAHSSTVNFNGIPQPGNRNPADPDIAVGPQDILLVANSTIARYSKTGQSLSQLTLQQWFSSLIPTICPISGAGGCTMQDPAVRYDAQHGRFLISAFSEHIFDGKTYFLLSVSNGATFEQGFKHWALEGSRNGTAQSAFELDFPQIGYDSVAVYLTANMINPATRVAQYAKIRILKKSELYSAATTVLSYQDIWDLGNEDGTKAFSIQPVVVRGKPLATDTPGLLINSSHAANATSLTLWRITNPIGPSPTAARTTLRNIWAYDVPKTFRQLDSVLEMDAGDGRILKAILRDGILYTARTTGYSDEPTTVTYDRIDITTDRVSGQARHIGGAFFYPAFDVPASHNPAAGFPNKLITGSTVGANGALTYLGITDVKAGEDRFEATNRWGDSFGASIDPIQGGLWVYGQYAIPRAGALGRWATRAAYFPLVTSTQFDDVTESNLFFDAINVLRLGSVTTGCADRQFCPGDSVTRDQMAAFVVRAVLGESFTFPTAPYFTDVPSTHPMFKYVQKVRELGINTGCTATTYCPDAFVTRGDIAQFLVRGKLRGLFGDNFVFPQTPYFTDVPATHARFPFVQKLRELGITSGCTTTTFCAEAAVTREQMAALLGRAFLY